MRFNGLALIASAVVLGACSKSEKPADTTAAAAATPATATPSTPAPAPGANPAVAAAPITGATHEVKMYGDDKGYRFEPKDITIKAGDGIKFTVANGGPHNIAFDPAQVADAKDQLNANMTGAISELSSPMLMNPGESYTISFGNIKPGKYPFHCTPHLAMNMTGSVTVQ